MQTLCSVAEAGHFTTEMFKVHPQSRSRNVLRLASQDRDAHDGANFRRFVGLRNFRPSNCEGRRFPLTPSEGNTQSGLRAALIQGCAVFRTQTRSLL
jgi:hypothetical protein